jgi:hypothetical protein
MWYVFITAYSQQKIAVIVKPSQVLIEKGENKQILNADFLVTNDAIDTFTLTKVSLAVFDEAGNLVHSRFLDNNGTAPSVLLMPGRVLSGVSSRLFFNPFSEFNSTLPLHKLSYEWTFEDTQDRGTKLTSIVYPVTYVQKETFLFPLKGKVLVYDAHDHSSHHRRFDYEFAPIKGLGFKSNFMRYAYDFVLVDSGRQFKTDGKRDEDYIGWAKPVYAVAAGKVIYASGTYKDDHRFDVPSLSKDPMALYGNYVAIEHAGGAVSVYAHLQQYSVIVKTGDPVTARQPIGAIGASGSAFFPHLHFEVRTNLTHAAEGLPSYFSNLLLVEGDRKTILASGLVETGNIIESR